MIPTVVSWVEADGISVVIPTRGRPELLQAVESALSQTMPPKEVIIIEDGPGLINEVARKWLDQHRGVVRVISCPEASGGPARPRNIGTVMAISPLVAFLDDDDWWLEEKLANQVRFMKQRNLVACGSNAFVSGEKDIEGNYFQNRMPKTRIRDFFRHNPLITSTVVCSRDALIAVGGFPEEPEYIGFEDHLAWIKLSALGRIGNLPEVTAFYRKITLTSLSGKLDAAGVDAMRQARIYGRRFAWRSGRTSIRFCYSLIESNFRRRIASLIKTS
jgi:glycosyltransferase involved in cell wall biosynthesis